MRTTVRALVGICALVAAGAADAKLIAVGDPFPSWTLLDQTGKRVSSSDLAGRTYLLWFFPKAMTPGCTAEGQGLRDQYAAFQARGVEILGISFDEPAKNAEFVAAEAFPFRLLSDRERSLSVAVGAADTTYQAVARRISYLVGPTGKVVRVDDTVDPSTHAGQVLKDVSQP